MTEERIGHWMQTYTGRKFWACDPRPEDVSIVDVAHALSMLCRYGGHSLRFYSVAEHCVIISRLCSVEVSMWGLLHDASEAYLVDIPKPIKPFLTNYKSLEENLMRCIALRFNLTWPCPEEVQTLDTRILGNERLKVMREGPSWSLTGKPLKDVSFYFWTPEQAEREFLADFEKLYWR